MRIFILYYFLNIVTHVPNYTLPISVEKYIFSVCYSVLFVIMVKRSTFSSACFNPTRDNDRVQC